MALEFQKLIQIEKIGKITIGINRNHANNFWCRQTLIGKILNWLFPVFIIFSVFIFLKFGFVLGVLTIVGIGGYVVTIQKVASMYTRILLLKNEKLFEAAYQAKSVTIKNNRTGKISHSPAVWQDEIDGIAL